tara:strand:- start:134 stop:925 length:792 start_codon:yes stop_codon:yes gene_type:complete
MALPDYLQETAKDYAKQLTAATSAPIDTSTFTGRQFVAGEDPLQSQAINLATQGIGSYQPFLQQAQTLTGPGAGTGAGSIASFMSPYQQGVIDETLRQYDQSRVSGRQDIQDQAVAMGAFGGGREGALLGQYDADSLANRTGLVAQLQQQNFLNAQNQRAQALQNQFALSNFQRAGQAADVANLGQLGAFRQGLDQSRLAADQQAAQTAAYEPFQRLSQYGTGITGLAGGVAGQQFQQPATPSPFSTALSTALGIGGLFGKFR